MLSNKQTAGELTPGSFAMTGWLAWGGVLVVAAVLLIVVNVRAADSDSGLHIGFVERLNTLPVSRWIAPEWWGLWGFEGLYREHPIGILIPPLILAKLGFPASQAPFLANAIYQVLSLVIIQNVAATVVPAVKARALSWMLQLIPIAFTYRIRANHEQAVLLLFFVALWSIEKSRKDARWISLLVFSTTAAVLVKGVFAAWLFMGCALWLLIIRNDRYARPIDRFRDRVRLDRRAWIGLAISFAAVLGVIAGYEFLYRQATHESFLAVYVSRQIGAAAVAKGSSYPAQKLSNLIFYGGRLLWFAFPGSLAVLAAIWKRSRREPVPERTRQAFVFSVGISLLYVVLFSLSDRHADRYIFPAYYLFAACGMILAANQLAWLHRIIERWDRHQQVFTPLLWLILFCLNLASGPAGVPHIEV
jgi:4-amino-4-deoxy-L-arabinose transferase-like glycosyltransferase